MFDPVVEKEESREAAESDEVLQESCPAPHSDSATGRAKQPRRISSHKPDEAFDDTEEWAKIADIVSSYGGRISCSGEHGQGGVVHDVDAELERLLRERAGHHSIQSVGEWLEGLGVAQYENTLVANGFDDTDFLGGKIMEDSDLAAIGISNEDHRTVIITAAHKMPPVQSIDQKRLPESVEVWLETLHLGQYLDTFVSHSYNTMQRVVQLWELELNTVLDISSLGHRKRVLASLGDRIQTEQDVSQSPSRKPKIACDKDEARRSPFEGVDLYCDYTGVKPQTACTSEQSPLNCIDTTEKNGGCSPEGVQDKLINIRPPHLMHTAGVIHQWRHQPEILIKGCCNYTAHYLGSTVVKELKETSTQEGIAKLKKSTEVINRIPTIVLSISYKGVKFIDGKSKKVVCDHEIANIFCACQDGEHLNFFAYITKDQETSRHYCHVFSVRSREQAGEIILTLGEAFEIAYQMALKEKVEEDVEQIEQQQLSQSDQDDSASLSSKTSVNTV